MGYYMGHSRNVPVCTINGINKNNWRNFYKIGDDGTLYPIEKEPNIPTKEKRIYETKSKLDNIIENFFDTGKFDI